MAPNHNSSLQSQAIQLIRRIRRLYRYLAISVGSNIGLMALIVYLGADRYFDPYTSLTSKRTEFTNTGSGEVGLFTNREVIDQLQKLTYGQLMVKLREGQTVEDGYTQRDLALAVLVSMHGLDIERALPQSRLEYRFFPVGSTGQKIPVFPGLTEKDYQQLLDFIQTERWPLTNRGLFFLIRAQRGKAYDSSLGDTFCQTEEFLAFKALFHGNNINPDRNKLIDMVLEGTWETLQSYSQLQRIQPDFSAQRRQSLLLEYLEQKVPLSAELLVEYEQAFALKRASDEQVMAILELLPRGSINSEGYAKELLLSPRSNAVWRKAALFLYTNCGEILPDPYDHLRTIARFIPAERLQFLDQKKPTPPILANETIAQEMPQRILIPTVSKRGRIYIVQQGDNLWKIGKRYGVSPEIIQDYNEMMDNRLQVGQELRIPAAN